MWSEVVLWNVTGEGVGERGKRLQRLAHQRGAHGNCLERGEDWPEQWEWWGWGHFSDGSDKTGEQQDVGNKGEARRESPSFKEYLKI